MDSPVNPAPSQEKDEESVKAMLAGEPETESVATAPEVPVAAPAPVAEAPVDAAPASAPAPVTPSAPVSAPTPPPTSKQTMDVVAPPQPQSEPPLSQPPPEEADPEATPADAPPAKPLPKLEAQPAHNDAHQPTPVKPAGNQTPGVGVAIAATTIIVLSLAVLAVLAYLKQA